VGFTASRLAIPIATRLAGTQAWDQFVQSLAANALYDIAKAATVSIFVLGGLYVSRERKRIGGEIAEKKEKELG
jgi:hypothetical protein